MNKINQLLFQRATSQRYGYISSYLAGFRQSFSSFKSDLSLDVLYPESKSQLFTPPPPAKSNDGNFNGYIPLDQLKITYSRSSGPGGQNVNCVDTKVDLRFHVTSVNFLSDETKTNFSKQFMGRITKDGFFVIRSDVTRSQQLNLADALEKLRTIIRNIEAAAVTKELSPETTERLRKRHEKAARERLYIKRHRSSIKNDRQNNSVDF